jgi:DNA repair protein SbcC/Rad50
MRLTRLYLRNFRVYEEPVDLEMPPGLVGIFGRNGAGKSTLLESITWTLWGRARTGKDQIRTSGVNADCVTEVEFEHEGHLYVVRRTISGLNHTVKAEAHADGSQVAEGVRDVARYVHSVLGMDDVAFRASVFAEQKQLAAFSSHAPAERRKLVMQLLGITPLEGAREQSRRDAKGAAERLQQLRQLLPDRAGIEKELSEAEAEAAAAASVAEAAEAKAKAEREQMSAAASALATLTEIGHEYDALVKEGQSLRRQRDETAERIGKTAQELATLDVAARRLVELSTQCAELEDMEARLALVKAVTAAADALGRLPEPTVPVDPDSLMASFEAISTAAQQQERELAETQGRLTASLAVRDQARQMAGRAEDLTGEADCPLCGQALGEAFEQVRSHRRAEVIGSESTVAGLEAAVKELAVAATTARTEVAAHQRALDRARAAWSTFQLQADRRAAAAEAHQRALAASGRAPEPAEEESLTTQVVRAKAARAESERLAGLLDARPRREADLAADTDRLASSDSELTNLRDKVKGLGFKPEALEAARVEAKARTDQAEAAGAEFQRRSGAATTALAMVEGHRRRQDDADRQHQALTELGEEARHLGRLADLLNVFRNNVVGSVGPTLSTQAAELFGELTDREYDRLEVDPDTYEIQIRDAGVAYGMDRYSGSETDLANLALRVAISEHVRFQSGGTVGLLVLDEVFGPLDEDRKERMLNALERLKGRFRQVLVVTHAADIKEQLPSAIEVVKLPGRRATARVVNRS